MLFVRKLLFLQYVIIFRWPAWAIIWLLGRFHIWDVLFVIYPVNSMEYDKMSWNFKFLRKMLSGNPLPGRLIIDSWKPAGLCFFVSNDLESLAKRKNHDIAKNIEKRMLSAKRLSGAKVVGFAGALGYVLEKRHKIKMVHPFYDSTRGNIFCLKQHILSICDAESTVCIVGGGPLGEALHAELKLQSQIVITIYRRKSDCHVLIDEMPQCGCIVNLLPSGDDFLALNIDLQQHTVIIDFSRPGIPKSYHPGKIIRANRLSRPGLRIFPPLPGGWQADEIPACSLPCLLASRGDLSVCKNQRDFNLIARYMRFKGGNHA